jgi:cytochrome P450
MNAHTALTRDIPAHVDPAQVVDFDMFHDHRYREPGGPHAALARLAAEDGRGIFWTPHNGGHWLINDHALLFEAVRMPELFSSTAMTIPPMPAELEPKLLPLFSDPPVHGPYRLPLMKAFAPARIAAMEGSIRAFAIELIEAVRGEERFDFFDKIAEPMPVVIFMKLMGMPLERMHEFRGWMVDMVSDSDEARAGAHRNVNAMNHLATDVALQERLRAEPGLIPEAVEEFLRMFAVATVARTVTRDAEFAGARLRAGERVMLMIPGANLDPALFPDPERFDLDRENKAHISFNSGPHRCVGSHLARLELRLFYEEWFRRMPNVRLDRERPPEYRTGPTLAVHKLPLVVLQSA